MGDCLRTMRLDSLHARFLGALDVFGPIVDKEDLFGINVPRLNNTVIGFRIGLHAADFVGEKEVV